MIANSAGLSIAVSAEDESVFVDRKVKSDTGGEHSERRFGAE